MGDVRRELPLLCNKTISRQTCCHSGAIPAAHLLWARLQGQVGDRDFSGAVQAEPAGWVMLDILAC